MNTITSTTRPELADNEHLILDEHMGTLDHKIELANRKLERNGIESRFTYTVTGQWELTDEGVVTIRKIVAISHPTIGLAGWDFIGTVIVEEGGTIVNMVPGEQTPAGFERPDNHNCDHCGVRRDRVKSYLVRNTETNEVKQVGSSCLELFFGLSIKGLWVLEAFTAEELAEMAEEASDREGGTDRRVRTYDVRFLIALAYVITNGGKGFVSRGNADPENGRYATADDVMETINYRPFGRVNYAEQEMMRQRKIDASALDPQIVDTILAFADTLGSSDYAQNAQVAAHSSNVSYRAVGVLVSLVGVWYRAQEKKASEETTPRLNEFYGDIKQRLRGLELTVVSMREIESDYGTSTLLVMRDAEGRTFKWFSSNLYDFEAGAVLTLDATVKDHEVYQDLNQTVLTRGKIHKIVVDGEEVN